MQLQEKRKKFFCAVESPECLLSLLRQSDIRIEDIRIFCSCSETEMILIDKRLSFELVTANVLKSEWENINSWAKEASLTWFRDRRVSQAVTINGVNFGDLCNRPISHCLIDQLKNYRLAQLISARTCGEKFIFIETKKQAVREIRGDGGSINDLLKLIFQQKPAAFIPFKVPSAGLTRSGFNDLARRIVGFMYCWLVSSKPRGSVFVGAGTLKLILPVLVKLNKGAQTIFLDESFQWLNYRTCRKHKITYRLFSSLFSSAEKARLKRQWDHSMEILRRSYKEIIENLPQFRYQNTPIPGIFNRLFVILKKRSFGGLLQAVILQNLHEKSEVGACLLHEDIDQYRGFAVASCILKIPVIVISHGIPPTRSDWSKIARGIGVADIVVNSEFEKDKYIMTGYAPERLHVLGLPRYDLIYERLLNIKVIKRQRKVILYCPHMLSRMMKRNRGYLGIASTGGETRFNSTALFEAIRTIDCELLVKLHGNFKDTHLWRELISREPSNKIRLIPYTADVFDLIANCDLVVATFSTVIIEAMLFQKNIVTLNFTSHPDIHPYAQRGIAYGVYHPENLIEAIQNCLFDGATQTRLATTRRQEMSYFGGPFDGSNTRRVVDLVEQLAKRRIPLENHNYQMKTL